MDAITAIKTVGNAAAALRAECDGLEEQLKRSAALVAAAIESAAGNGHAAESVIEVEPAIARVIRPRRAMTPREVRKMVALRSKGMAGYKIAELLGRSSTSVYRWLNK